MLNVLKQIADQLLSPDKLIRKRYHAFRNLLERDRSAHALLAEIEHLHYGGKAVDSSRLRMLFDDYSAQVKGMIECLDILAGGEYRVLRQYHKKFDFYGRFALAPPALSTSPPYSVVLDRSLLEQDCDESLLGGKGRNLALLFSVLRLPVPPTCIITTSAWNLFVEQNQLRPKIAAALAVLDVESYASLERCAVQLREEVMTAELPAELSLAIAQAAARLTAGGNNPLFAVRSSSVAEDSDSSFAGQYASILQVQADGLEAAWRKVAASKYSAEALQYRILNGFDDEATPMAVIIQPMVGGSVSGVIVTDSQGNNRVDYVPGYGDRLMGGAGESLSVRARCDGRDDEEALEISGGLSRQELQRLSCHADTIAGYYQGMQEIEWSFGGEGSWILQARPYSSELESDEVVVDPPELPLLFTGGEAASIGGGGASGIAYRLDDIRKIAEIPDGALLVCDDIPPALVAVIPRLCGVIAGKGSRADHFSSVAREFRLPVLARAGQHIERIPGGEPITFLPAITSVFLGEWKNSSWQSPTLQLPKTSPVAKALKMVVDFTSPLRLTDPQSKDFRPESCRSLHDIVRFVHEKAVQAMFLSNPDSFFRKPGSRLLHAEIPLQMHIINLAELGQIDSTRQRRTISCEDVQSEPFQALWRGLTHPGTVWGERSHFDWKSYDAVALAGGVAGKGDEALASYAMVSAEYLNVHFRFGYHFALIDCLCSSFRKENYLLLRFAGGGGTATGKDLRLDCIEEIMARLGCLCERSGDMLDCRHSRLELSEMLELLDQIGRLLAATRILDMALADTDEVQRVVEAFFAGKYNFLKGSPEL